MVGDNLSISPFVFRGGGSHDVRSLILGPECKKQVSIALVSSSVFRVFHSPVFSASGLPLGAAFSSSAGSTQSPTPKISSPSHEFPPPPPVNPPETVNPDPATLREQWRYATRMYSRWYAHAWGTAILAGVSFYALGWLIKGGNPIKGKQEEKKEEK